MATAKPVVIMGAGPAGLTAAWELVRSGREVVVWEADPSYVGGIARTVQAEGYRFDLGGHLFQTKSPEVQEFWRKILPDDFIEIPSVTRILDRGKLLDYPLNPKKAGYKHSFVEGFKTAWSFSRAQGRPLQPEQNLEQWLSNRHGQRLYEQVLKACFEKIVGLSCDKISPALAERYLQAPPGDNRKFPYPRLGPGQLWEAVANRVLERGSNIFLGRRVQTVHWNETGVTHITGTNVEGEFFQQEGSHFLASIPLRELLLALDPPPPKEVAAAAWALQYRDLINVSVIVNRPSVFPETALLISDPAVKVANILNYKNWSADLVTDGTTTSLGLGYFCSRGDNLWNATDYDLAQLAIREVVQLGFIKESEVKDAFVARMPNAVPVYDLNFQRNLEVIKQWIGLFFNLQPIGRNGLHSYNYQDHSMVTAMLAVRNIQGGQFDCWNVAADPKIPAKT